jgi:hypothetical protein
MRTLRAFSVGLGLLLPAVAVAAGVSPLHPPVELIDIDGGAALETGKPLSTMRTCGTCHDTDYIAGHSYHVWLGSDEGEFASSGRGFDHGPGAIGRFDPLTYERFDPKAFDLGLADWLRRFGERHVGGGFAAQTSDGRALSELGSGADDDPLTRVRGSRPGTTEPWDWQASGVVEMNCFLCHLSAPAVAERRAELRAGRFSWAATATLAETGLVTREEGGWRYVAGAFDADGKVLPTALPLRRPSSRNCGICHGVVHEGVDEPFFSPPSVDRPLTETTGEIFAGTRIRRSGMNVAGKNELSRPWDVHAERLLACGDCHGSLNNPAFFAESEQTQPGHLKHPTGRLGIGEFLKTPSHDFGKGHSSQATVARDLDGTGRDCVDCHRLEGTHTWLPSVARHMTNMRCEACHVPRLFAAARQQTDWTLLGADQQALVGYRGVRGDPHDPRTLIAGYEPLLLPRSELDGDERLSPQNLVSSWYWLDRERNRPVPLPQLRQALFGASGNYRGALVKALDADGDGALSRVELRLDSSTKVAAVQQLLRGAGVADAEIRAELQPYGVHHGVAPGGAALRDCGACHGERARFSRDAVLAEYVPGGVLPTLVGDATVRLAGDLLVDGDGKLLYRPNATKAGIYLLGYESYPWVDIIGRWSLILVVIGVLIHGGTRVFLASFADSAKQKREVRS